MNPYVQEWIWMYSKAKGVAKYVLLAIGRRIEANKRGFESEPLPTQEIAADTGLADSTVREHIKTLAGPTGELEVVKAQRRGEVHRYRLRRELQLPLIDMAPARVRRRLAAVTAPDGGGESSADSPPPFGDDSADFRQRQPAAAVKADVSSELVRTEVLTTTTDEPLEQEVADFLEWFHVEYVKTRGFPYRVKRDAAERIVRELLADRSLDRLKTMATLMLTAVHDQFIVPSDRSLFVLAHKATYLEGIAVANEQRREAAR